MAKIRIVALLEVDNENIDTSDFTGLTKESYDRVKKMFPSLDIIDMSFHSR